MRGVEDPARCRPQPLVIVGNHQLHPTQAAVGERAQKGGPEGFGLRGTGGNSQHLAPAIAVDAHTRSAFARSHETYGSPRVTCELQVEGVRIGRRRAARLMRENGLKARQKRRFKRTTDSHYSFPIAPNLIEQDFSAEGPNQKWAADLSYVWTGEGWLYLAVILDLFARRVVGRAVSDRLHQELALEALRKALAIRQPSPGLIHHADRGSQYCATAYQAELKKYGIQISMSGKGNCPYNAVVESFFKTLKSELIWRTVFQTRAKAKEAIGRYIDGFYNPVRGHLTLDYVSPAQFERLAG